MKRLGSKHRNETKVGGSFKVDVSGFLFNKEIFALENSVITVLTR